MDLNDFVSIVAFLLGGYALRLNFKTDRTLNRVRDLQIQFGRILNITQFAEPRGYAKDLLRSLVILESYPFDAPRNTLVTLQALPDNPENFLHRSKTLWDEIRQSRHAFMNAKARHFIYLARKYYLLMDFFFQILEEEERSQQPDKVTIHNYRVELLECSQEGFRYLNNMIGNENLPLTLAPKYPMSNRRRLKTLLGKIDMINRGLIQWWQRLKLRWIRIRKRNEYHALVVDFGLFYLRIAQTCFQRPSPEYQYCYSEVTKAMENLIYSRSRKGSGNDKQKPC
jgi:hypothetical protein